MEKYGSCMCYGWIIKEKCKDIRQNYFFLRSYIFFSFSFIFYFFFFLLNETLRIFYEYALRCCVATFSYSTLYITHCQFKWLVYIDKIWINTEIFMMYLRTKYRKLTPAWMHQQQHVHRYYIGKCTRNVCMCCHKALASAPR